MKETDSLYRDNKTANEWSHIQSNGKLEGVVTVTELAQWIDWTNWAKGNSAYILLTAQQGCIFPLDINTDTL